MKLDIKGIGFSATEAIRDRVARRVGVALSRRTDQVLRVVVRLQDLNGPRGGHRQTLPHRSIPGPATRRGC